MFVISVKTTRKTFLILKPLFDLVTVNINPKKLAHFDDINIFYSRCLFPPKSR